LVWSRGLTPNQLFIQPLKNLQVNPPGNSGDKA